MGRYSIVETDEPEDLNTVCYLKEVDIATLEVTGEGITVNEGGITIEINGAKYIALVENGTATIQIPNLKPGTYSGNVTYNGGSNFNHPSESVEFTVDPYVVTIENISISGTVYGDRLTIMVNLINEFEIVYEGTVTLEMFKKKYTADVIYGTAIIEIEGLNAGEYWGEVTYDGGDSYTTPTEEIEFNITQRIVSLDIDYENITCGENATITVNVLSDGTAINEGYVIIDINGLSLRIKVTDGVAQLTLPDLKTGTYPANISFDGGDNYNSPSEEIEIKVTQKVASLDIEYENITYGENATINIKVLSDGTAINEGYVIIDINGLSLRIKITDGVAQLTLPNLNTGTYPANISFDGGDNYNCPSEIITLEVKRVSVEMEVHCYTHTYGETQYIAVFLTHDGKDITEGTVTAVINNIPYTSSVENGMAVIEMANLNAGTYTGNVTFSAGSNYDMPSEDVEFTVSKTTPELDIQNIIDVNYGYSVIITVKVTNNRKSVTEGYINVTDGEKSYGAFVKNGMAWIEIPMPDAGFHIAKVNYIGTVNYNDASDYTSFNVKPDTAKIEVTQIENNTYGETLKLTVSVTGTNADVQNGTVTVIVNNRNYTAKVENGNAVVEIPDLEAGSYTGFVSLEDNENFRAETETVSFDVERAEAEMIFDCEDITYGDVATVTVHVYWNDIEVNDGNVIVSIAGGYYFSPVQNYGAVITIPNLNAGTYEGTVTYDGGDNFEAIVEYITVNVERRDADIEIEAVERITYGDVLTVLVKVTSEGEAVPDGAVTIEINGKSYFAIVENGEASIDMEDLDAGFYAGEVTYNGGTNYNTATKPITFNVDKADAQIKVVEIEDNVYGETLKITANVTSPAATVNGETLKIIVNNKEYLAKVVDGTATVEIPELTAGTYTAYIGLEESLNYNAPTETFDFDIERADATLVIEYANITYGDAAIITVHVKWGSTVVNEGTVRVSLNNNEYTAAIEDGTAKVTIAGLNVGTYQGYLEYDGGDNFNAMGEDISIDVAKKDVKLEINVPETIVYGDKFIFTAKVTGNGEAIPDGTVLIKINDKTYFAVVENGNASINITGLNAGFYHGNATYNGGNNYNTPMQSFGFDVSKKTVQFNEINVTNIVYGDTVNITANVTVAGEPADVGRIYIVINNKNHAAKLENGTATISIADLDAGTYYGVLSFTAGSNYEAPSQEIEFEVTKKIVSINVTYANITYGEVATVTIHVTSGNESIDEGDIRIKVNGRTFLEPVKKGVATLTIPNLDAGTYVMELTYDGGSNYNNPSETIDLDVSQKIVSLSVEGKTALWGEEVTITVHATSGSETIKEGLITMTLNGNQYIAILGNGETSFTLKNFEVGSYKGTVEFDAGSNYNTPQAGFDLNIIKRDAKISASNAKCTINYDHKFSTVIKDSTGKVIANEKVQFYLNGKSIGFAFTDNNGKAVIQITSKQLKTAKAGNRNLVVQFSNSHYNTVEKTVKLKINKEKTKITAKMKTFRTSQKTKKFTVTIKDSKKKTVKKLKVTLKVNGKTYKATTNSKGKATFKITKLTKTGTFKAAVKFKGDKYYKASKKNTKIRVK